MSGNLSSISGGGIKSVQQGYITIAGASTSNTATIASVNTAKSVCFCSGATSTEAVYGGAVVQLSNATTVSAFKDGASYPITVGYTVVEFY